ncbi:MAG: polymer-forming cytoskeletal protein [Hyphomicrobiaceae bacterium]
MAGQGDVTIIREDAFLKGRIRRCHHIQIEGYVEGEIIADEVIVQPSGRLFGKVRAQTLDVLGFVQGDVTVLGLCRIAETGTLNGNVVYGQLTMDAGGNLSADVRNVPPTIDGDFELTVDKGRAVRITTHDLTVHDPDDVAENLVYTITNPRNGSVVLSDGGNRPVESFTQADIIGDRVLFLHDGSHSNEATFDVVVADSQGATSGEPRRVTIAVRG